MSTQDQPLDNQPHDRDDDDFETAFNEYAGKEPDDLPDDEGGEQDTGAGKDPGTGQADADDDLSERLQALESENQRLKHSESSQRGRLGAYQRQINELQRQLQEVQQGSAPAGRQGGSGSGGGKGRSHDQQRQDMAESMGLEDWEEFKEDFPDMARAFEARLNADRQKQAQLEQQIAELRSTVQPIQEQAHQQHLESEYARLQDRHSDWREVVNAPAFQQWLQTQNPGIQQLAASDSADDASALLDFYKASGGSAGSSRADSHDKRRERLAQAQSVPRRGTSPREGVPDEFEAAFQHYANRKRQAR